MLKEIIDKWKLNHNLLAEKMGMPKGTFNNKLSKQDFTDDELDRLKNILLTLRDDLEGISEIDFNDALRLISQKEL